MQPKGGDHKSQENGLLFLNLFTRIMSKQVLKAVFSTSEVSGALAWGRLPPKRCPSELYHPKVHFVVTAWGRET